MPTPPPVIDAEIVDAPPSDASEQMPASGPRRTSKLADLEAKVTTALPAVAKVLDSLATPMERSHMDEPAAALRRGAGHARAISDNVTATLAAGRSLFSTLAQLLPPPRPTTPRTPRTAPKKDRP